MEQERLAQELRLAENGAAVDEAAEEIAAPEPKVERESDARYSRWRARKLRRNS
jgi:hypothetical protein